MMLRKLCLLGAAAGAFSAAGALAQTAEVTLTRLECGSGFNDARRFSDTFAYNDPKIPFTFSCYVIKHADDYMVWDTGYAPGSTPNATNKPLGELLAQMKVKPGHTPGHQSLLVRLKEKGPVILIGDAAHFHENYESDGVPGFNYDRAETIASLERIKGIAKNLKATVIIQHDPRDISKLPAFPAAAK